jgi:hypothetical protein
MPNEHDYREAAQRCRTIGEHLLRAAGPGTGWAPSFVGAGSVADTVASATERIRGHLAAAGEELGRLALRCDERADVCADHARAIARYDALDDAERRWTNPPRPPASWVSA